MGIIRRMRRQNAVYWPKTGKDAFGKPKFGAAVPVKCRWVDTAVEYQHPNGQQRVSNAVVNPDMEMKPGDLLALMDFEDVDPDQDPLLTYKAKEIQRFDNLPNLRVTERLYTAYL